MSARSVELTLIAASAPEGWDKSRLRRRPLLPPLARAAVLRWRLGQVAREQAGRRRPRHLAAGLFESGDYMARAVRLARRRRPAWRFGMGRPNNVIRGKRRGNALVTYGSDLQHIEDLHVDVGPRELHLPVFESEAMQLRVIVAHRETQRADPDGKGRKAAHDALKRAVSRYRADGWHVVVLADWNGGPPDVPILRVLERAGVDSISATSGVQLVRSAIVPAPRVTDHRVLVVAHVRVPLVSRAAR